MIWDADISQVVGRYLFIRGNSIVVANPKGPRVDLEQPRISHSTIDRVTLSIRRGVLDRIFAVIHSISQVSQMRDQARFRKSPLLHPPDHTEPNAQEYDPGQRGC